MDILLTTYFVSLCLYALGLTFYIATLIVGTRPISEKKIKKTLLFSTSSCISQFISVILQTIYFLNKVYLNELSLFTALSFGLCTLGLLVNIVMFRGIILYVNRINNISDE